MIKDDNIQKVYEACVKTICLIDEEHHYSKKQNEIKVQSIISMILKEISYIIKWVYSNEHYYEWAQKMTEILKAVMQSQECSDNIAMDDNVYYSLKKLMESLVRVLQNQGYSCDIDFKSLADVPDNYILCDATMGKYSLKIADGNNIYHNMCSARDPYEEGIQVAEHIYQILTEVDEYGTKKIYIYGLGLGYHILHLGQYSDITDIYVYETDSNIIKIAKAVNPQVFLDEKVHVILDSELKKFAADIDDVSNIYIYRPSLANIKNPNLKESMEQYYLKANGIVNEKMNLIGNYSKNMQLNDESVDKLKSDFYDKIMFLIAGGPSLDDDIETLKNVQKQHKDKIVIVAVGRVIKRLLSEQIIPDYTVITDPKVGMKSQIEGIDYNKIATKLLYLSTVASEVPYTWTGKRYIIYQKGWKLAEEYAKKNGLMLFATGGSVSLTTFELGLQMKCRAIITVGLDLAYYKEHMHATGTDLIKFKMDTGIYTKAVDGGKVMTSANLESYKKWLEQRIEKRNQEEQKVLLINCSKGAYIEGMQHQELLETVKIL